MVPQVEAAGEVVIATRLDRKQEPCVYCERLITKCSDHTCDGCWEVVCRFPDFLKTEAGRNFVLMAGPSLTTQRENVLAQYLEAVRRQQELAARRAWRARGRGGVVRYNAFAEAARARRVVAFLNAIPTGRTAAENLKIAAYFSALSPEERKSFADHVGVNVPSEETWAKVCEALRARKTVDEVLAKLAVQS